MFFTGRTDEGSSLSDIPLVHSAPLALEGQMRGQAYVTFPSVHSAPLALEYVASTKYSGQKCGMRETIVGAVFDKVVAQESVGVKPATLVPKEIHVIKRTLC